MDTVRSICIPLVTVLLGIGMVATACGPKRNASGEFTSGTAGILTVATSLPAPGFWEGESVDDLTGGMEYGLAQQLADDFGLELRIVDVSFQRIVEGDLGGADLAIAQIAITRERRDGLEFTAAYRASNAGVLVRPGTEVADLAEARSRSWAVEAETIHVDFVQQVIRPDREPTVVPSIERAVEMVADGSVDAALLDLELALAYAKESDGALDVAAQFITRQQIAIALPKGSENVEAIDAALRRLIASDVVRQLEEDELEPALGRDPDSVPVIVARTPR